MNVACGYSAAILSDAGRLARTSTRNLPRCQRFLLRGDLDAFVDVVPDDQLRLMFLCCHPSLTPEAQRKLVHNLEHGYSILWYDETVAQNTEQVAAVKAIADKFKADTGIEIQYVAVNTDEVTKRKA